jgi:hypothetical protein
MHGQFGLLNPNCNIFIDKVTNARKMKTFLKLHFVILNV